MIIQHIRAHALIELCSVILLLLSLDAQFNSKLYLRT
jgi:hypothetical protein